MNKKISTARITDTVLMIRPVRFDLNEETLESNAFQDRTRSDTPETINAKALGEFDTFVEKLRKLGVEVIVFSDTPEPYTPDSIFPNNWVSFHPDGKVVTYPMQAVNRRKERRLDIIEALKNEHHLYVEQVLAFETKQEPKNQFLEGTGSLVIDRINRISYACRSPRTHDKALADWSKLMDCRCISFKATDENGQEIYHTNVLMCLGDYFAVVCLDAIKDEKERQEVIETLEQTDREVIGISHAQMNSFAGNMLQVKNEKAERILVMSESAFQSLDATQVTKLKEYNDYLLQATIPTIEQYGGGSARCMIAEVFLPPA
ncbi:MAG: citrulline utilization hydrolase CtlX [Chitinophagales bacterium]